MKHQITYLHCGDHLKGTLKNEIEQVIEVVETIEWNSEFTIVTNNTEISHQTAYNKRFEIEFDKLG